MRFLVGLCLLGALACLPLASARADWHFGFGLFGNRPPKTVAVAPAGSVVTLQAQMPACAVCTPAMAIPAQLVAAPAYAPAPQPVTVQLMTVQAAPAPPPAAPAPVMLQAAPVAAPPDRYYLLRIDGATGAASIAPCAPK
ncbi:MAG: hypothetical protein KGL39_35490 [Patescibacteria group bacterium]|nr:hypothetical protein [Patescibacteria group bacterium]